MEHTDEFFRLLGSIFFLSFFLVLMNSAGPVTTATGSITSGFTNETDSLALLAIKDVITGDPFRVFSSWNNSLHFCNWHGVTCSRRHQRVTMLDLSSLNLVGFLSPYIGNLTFLRRIHLENNSFRGTIPQELGRLFRLQHLVLLNNSFQGEFPINLTHCSDIKIINIYKNNIGGRLPTELGSLSNLIALRLSRNHFTGLIPPSFGNLSTLSELYLSTNNLEGSIPFELGKLSNLEFLQLSLNNLSGVVPTSLYNISSIKFFALAGNEFRGSLPPNLGLTLPKLQTFFFGGNQLSGPIPSSISNASGLGYIDISSNALTGQVPMNLGNLGDLELLNLEFNSLGTDKGDDFGFLSSLSNCSNLRILYFTDNHLRGKLPNSIGNLSTKFITLELNMNYISGTIPLEIGNLLSLIVLALGDNMLTGTIPGCIGKLLKLQYLYIEGNKIMGKIPSSVGNLTQLNGLALPENMLEGSIPTSLGNCKNLQLLDLSSNQLIGVIPEQIIGLSSLSTRLNLARNYLTGPLPLQVGSLKNLGMLDISENKLSGEIPSTLGNCLVLEQLYMQGNNFIGTVPPSFKQLKAIQALDLSRNNLSGQIPSFLGEFPLTQYLNLSFNMFEGQVPTEGIFKNISAFSIVRNKKLCGGIRALQLPACPAKVSVKKRKPFTHIIVPLIVTLVVVLLLACLSAILYLRRRSIQQTSLPTPLQNQYPKLSFAELFQATNEFSSDNLIGEGRYGFVYRGILNSADKFIAVKVLKLQQHGANKSFFAECEALRNIRHRNLVKIITSCSSIDFKGNDFKALVFEFMPNGSLESWLHSSLSEQQDPKNLNLVHRLNIAIDVASALDYLHHHCETTIIHCDLKSSNVLLDNELCAHVGDFGLARFLTAGTGKSNHTPSGSSNGIRGTFGYVAPEYGMGAEVSSQGDVYSYGILLLEMFTGKRPTDSTFTDDFCLHNYAKMSLPGRVMQIVDPLLILDMEDACNRAGQFDIGKTEECLMSILRLGVTCSAELPRERMDIRDALMELHLIRNVFLGMR